MANKFSKVLAEGKINSLGRANEVLELVLDDKTLLPRIYECIFDDNEWVRLRAADVFEKVAVQNPDWIENYTEKLFTEVAEVKQAGVRWHLVQILGEIKLSPKDKLRATELIKSYLADPSVDWIVANNSLIVLDKFSVQDSELAVEMPKILKVQTNSKHGSVAKRATKLLAKY